MIFPISLRSDAVAQPHSGVAANVELFPQRSISLSLRQECDGVFALPPLPPVAPAVASAAVAAIWPKPVKATTSAVAAVGICGRSRYGCAESGYPGHAQDLCSDVAEGVGENDRHHRQAPHQECSYALAKDYCHGLHPSTGESVNYPGFANERASMPAVPSEPAFDLSLSVIAPAELDAQVGRSDALTVSQCNLSTCFLHCCNAPGKSLRSSTTLRLNPSFCRTGVRPSTEQEYQSRRLATRHHRL